MLVSQRVVPVHHTAVAEAVEHPEELCEVKTFNGMGYEDTQFQM